MSIEGVGPHSGSSIPRESARASNGDFAAGFRCLIPAAPAVPAAAANQQNDKYDDEKRGGIHVELLLAVPFSHFAFALRLQQPF
jgi:hypothetical protein